MKITVLMLLFSSLLFGEVYAIYEAISQKSATLSPDANGIVAKINVDVGSVVKKGDILLELDSSTQHLAIELSKANLQLSRLKLEQTKLSFERYKKIDDLIDKENFENVEFAYKMAQADVTRAEVTLKQALDAKDKMILKAPFDGIISQKLVELGDSISQAARTKAFVLESNRPTKLLLSFDQKYLSQVKIGSIYRYKSDIDPKIKESKIIKIYPTIDAQKRVIKAEALSDSEVAGAFGDGYIE